MSFEDEQLASHEKWGYPGSVEVLFDGIPGEGYRKAVDEGVNRLAAIFGGQLPPVLQGLRIVITNDLIEGGAEAFPEDKRIVLDKDKNTKSLKQAEEFVIGQTGYDVAPGDMSQLLDAPTAPYSSAIVNIVHESAHVLDKLSAGDVYNRLNPSFSPTQYGKKSPHEAFAEAFTYLAFGKEITPEAKLAVEEVINQSRGES